MTDSDQTRMYIYWSRSIPNKNQLKIHRCISWVWPPPNNSHHKDYSKCQQVTRKVLRKNTHKTAPHSSKSPLLFCDRGASLCNPGLLAGEFNVSIQECMVPSDGPNPSRPNRASGWHKPTKSPDRRLTSRSKKVCGRYAPTNLTLLYPTSLLCGDRSGWLRHDRRRKITFSFQML